MSFHGRAEISGGRSIKLILKKEDISSIFDNLVDGIFKSGFLAYMSGTYLLYKHNLDRKEEKLSKIGYAPMYFYNERKKIKDVAKKLISDKIKKSFDVQINLFKNIVISLSNDFGINKLNMKIFDDRIELEIKTTSVSYRNINLTMHKDSNILKTIIQGKERNTKVTYKREELPYTEYPKDYFTKIGLSINGIKMKKINPQKHFLHNIKIENYSPTGDEDKKLYLFRGIAKDSNVNIVFPTLIDKEVQLFNRFFSYGRTSSKGFRNIVDEIKKKASELVTEKLSNKYKDKKWNKNDFVEDARRIKEGYDREVMRVTRQKRPDDRYYDLEDWRLFSSNDPQRSVQMTRTLIPIKSFYELVKQYFDKGFTEYQKEYFVDRLKDVMYAQYLFDNISLRMIRKSETYITTSPSYLDKPNFSISNSIDTGKKIEINSIFDEKLIHIKVKVTYIEPLVINYQFIFNSKGILTMKSNLIYKQSDATYWNYPFNLKFGEFEYNYEIKIDLQKDNLYRETGTDRTIYRFMVEGILYPLRKKLFGLDEYNVPIVSWSTPPFVLFNRALYLAFPYNESEFYQLQSKANSYNQKELSDDEKILYEKYSKNREIFSTTTDIPFGLYKNFWKNLIKRWFGTSIEKQFYIGKELDEKGKPKKYGSGFVIVPNTDEAEKYYYMMFDKHSIENWEKKAKEENLSRWQGMGLYQFNENSDGSHYITSYFAPIYVDALSQAMLNDNKFSIGKVWFVSQNNKDVTLTYAEQMQNFKSNFNDYKKWLEKIDTVDSISREYYVRELVLMNKNGFLSKNEYNLLISQLNQKDIRSRNNPQRYKYMTLDEIKPFESLMDKKKVSEVARGIVPSKQTNTGFLVAYKRAKGDIPTIEQMKNGFGDQTWGERRHGFIARHAEQMKKERAFDENGDPTRRHLGLIAWAYTPYPKQIKNWIKKNKRNNPKKKEIRDKQGLLIPKKYLKGFKGKELDKRIKEIGDRRKEYAYIFEQAKKDGRKPTREELKTIYRPFETDKKEKDAKTKISPYTQEAHERGFVGSLKNKQRVASEYYKGEIPYSTIKEIFDKGKAAWASGGHRKYQTPESWGYARVNSFLVGGKTFFTADNKIAKETLPKNVYNAIKKKSIWSTKLHKIVRTNPQSYPKANLIYGRTMTEKDWYRPLDHYDYYYHVPKKNNIINTDKLLDSIDKDIYEIVRIAHEKGLSTNSSCQGHFFTIEELKQKYKKAKEDEKQIRDNGLILENVETGEHIIWQQSDYKFPYTQTKYIEIMRKKPRGYLPIYLHEKTCGICKKLDDKDITYEFDKNIGLLEFHVDEINESKQLDLWNDITDVFKNYYDK